MYYFCKKENVFFNVILLDLAIVPGCRILLNNVFFLSEFISLLSTEVVIKMLNRTRSRGEPYIKNKNKNKNKVKNNLPQGWSNSLISILWVYSLNKFLIHWFTLTFSENFSILSKGITCLNELLCQAQIHIQPHSLIH